MRRPSPLALARATAVLSIWLPIFLPLAIYLRRRAPTPRRGLIDRPLLLVPVVWVVFLVVVFGVSAVFVLLGGSPV